MARSGAVVVESRKVLTGHCSLDSWGRLVAQNRHVNGYEDRAHGLWQQPGEPGQRGTSEEENRCILDVVGWELYSMI